MYVQKMQFLGQSFPKLQPEQTDKNTDARNREHNHAAFERGKMMYISWRVQTGNSNSCCASFLFVVAPYSEVKR